MEGIHAQPGPAPVMCMVASYSFPPCDSGGSLKVVNEVADGLERRGKKSVCLSGWLDGLLDGWWLATQWMGRWPLIDELWGGNSVHCGLTDSLMD